MHGQVSYRDHRHRLTDYCTDVMDDDAESDDSTDEHRSVCRLRNKEKNHGNKSSKTTERIID